MSILRLTGLAVCFVGLCAAAPINVALSANGGVATQSTTDWSSPASRANDGNTSGNWNDDSVSHTAYETNAWWQVEFDAPTFISSIAIFNRTDCCMDRINTFSVFLYDSANSEVWKSTGNSILLPATSAMFTPGNILASSLKIQLEGTEFLQLAEVQAFQAEVPEPATYGMMAGGLLLLGMLHRRKR